MMGIVGKQVRLLARGSQSEEIWPKREMCLFKTVVELRVRIKVQIMDYFEQ